MVIILLTFLESKQYSVSWGTPWEENKKQTSWIRRQKKAAWMADKTKYNLFISSTMKISRKSKSMKDQSPHLEKEFQNGVITTQTQQSCSFTQKSKGSRSHFWKIQSDFFDSKIDVKWGDLLS